MICKLEARGKKREEGGKYKTFDERMEDLRRYKDFHGDVSTLAQICIIARYTHKNPGKGMPLTNEKIVALDLIDLCWTSQEYITRCFDEWI